MVLDFSGDHDPSNWLVDLAYTANESKTLQFLRWEDCTSRRMELNKVTTDKSWATDASGRFFMRLPVSILDHLSSAPGRRAVWRLTRQDVTWKKMMLTRMREACLARIR